MEDNKTNYSTKDTYIKREDVPKDFWNYSINPITGTILNERSRKKITEQDVSERKYSVVKRG